MNRRTALLMFLPILTIAVSTQAGQTSSNKSGATIKGMVLDANGKPVPAAAVTCQSSAGIHPRVVHSDARGNYVVAGLKQDSYDLRATSKGAYSDWEKNIPVRKGQTKEITLRLLNGNTALSGELPKK
jgi:uncharacterized membrane protein